MRIMRIFYRDIFPYILMPQFGGSFQKWGGDADIVELECIDNTNTVKKELRRIRNND